MTCIKSDSVGSKICRTRETISTVHRHRLTTDPVDEEEVWLLP
jgi:hypothetical protein